jgi:nucleotide-binding universal stress UspA family protein
MSIFPTKILLTTDGSEDAELATNTAVNLAQETGSELHVIHVLALPLDTHDPSSFEPEVRQQLEARARRSLEEETGTIKASGGAVEGSHLRVGRPDAEIVAMAEEIGAGLIVMGGRGVGGIRRALMGSVSDSVVRHAHCPVMVVRGEPVSFPTKILLATDGSKDAELAATTAADLAKSASSEVHVVSVFPGTAYVHPSLEVRFPEAAERLRREAREERQEMLDEQVKRIQKAGGDVAQTHIRTGRTAEEIVALAEEMDAGLVVMGSRGLGGIRRAWMGSVSSEVVPHAHCPVLVVRPEKPPAT